MADLLLFNSWKTKDCNVSAHELFINRFYPPDLVFFFFSIYFFLGGFHKKWVRLKLKLGFTKTKRCEDLHVINRLTQTKIISSFLHHRFYIIYWVCGIWVLYECFKLVLSLGKTQDNIRYWTRGKGVLLKGTELDFWQSVKVICWHFELFTLTHQSLQHCSISLKWIWSFLEAMDEFRWDVT